MNDPSPDEFANIQRQLERCAPVRPAAELRTQILAQLATPTHPSARTNVVWTVVDSLSLPALAFTLLLALIGWFGSIWAVHTRTQAMLGPSYASQQATQLANDLAPVLDESQLAEMHTYLQRFVTRRSIFAWRTTPMEYPDWKEIEGLLAEWEQPHVEENPKDRVDHRHDTTGCWRRIYLASTRADGTGDCSTSRRWSPCHSARLEA